MHSFCTYCSADKIDMGVPPTPCTARPHFLRLAEVARRRHIPGTIIRPAVRDGKVLYARG